MKPCQTQVGSEPESFQHQAGDPARENKVTSDAVRLGLSIEQLFRHWIAVFNITYSGPAFSFEWRDETELPHHRTERLAMAFAAFLRKEIEGSRQRYSFYVVNMDGTLVVFSINVCARTYCILPRDLARMPDSDGVPGNLLFHFVETTLLNVGQNVALKVLEFDESHHLMEAFFKAVALTLNTLQQQSQTYGLVEAKALCEGRTPQCYYS